MPRSSQFETFSDGEYMYDDRYDAGEFTTYGQSHGPTSNPFSDGVSHSRNTSYSSSRASRQPPYDEYDYPIAGAYAGKEGLRRRTSRYPMGEPSIYTGPRTRLGRDDQFGRRSRLSEQPYADEHEEQDEVRRREQAELDYQIQAGTGERESRCSERDAFASRGSGRRAAVPTLPPKMMNISRINRHCASNSSVGMRRCRNNVRGYERGYFPAYEFR